MLARCAANSFIPLSLSLFFFFFAPLARRQKPSMGAQKTQAAAAWTQEGMRGCWMVAPWMVAPWMVVGMLRS